MSTSTKEGPISGRRRYDPRLGDEDDGPPTPRHVRIPKDVPHPSDSEKPLKPRPDASRIPVTTRIAKLLPLELSWIRPNLTWSKFKPVIRCSVVCWVSALFMIIGPTSRALGMVSLYIQVLYARGVGVGVISRTYMRRGSYIQDVFARGGLSWVAIMGPCEGKEASLAIVFLSATLCEICSALTHLFRQSSFLLLICKWNGT